MVLSVLSSIAYLLVIILLITIGAAILLGIGTVLTLLFAVSVWEATVVVMAVAAGAVWLLPRSDVPPYVDDYPEGSPEEEEWEPPIAVTDFVIRPNRRQRRRKR